MSVKKIATFVFVIAATAFFYLLWWNSSLLASVDSKMYDLLASRQMEIPKSQATVIVDIDEKSLQLLGQWPWPRVIVAELLVKIASMNPASTAVDIAFPEPDRTSPSEIGKFYTQFFHFDTHLSGVPEALLDNDRLLADAMAHMNLTLPVFFDATGSLEPNSSLFPSALPILSHYKVGSFFSSPYLVQNIPILQRSASSTGHIQASADADGILRRLPLFIRYNDTLIPILGLSAISSLDSQMKLTFGKFGESVTINLFNHTIRTDEQAQVLLRFYPPQWYKHVSAVDVLRGNVDPSLFIGKYVLVGASAMGLHDRHRLNDGSVRPGIVAHATFIENFFDDALISESSLYHKGVLFLSFLSAIALMFLMHAKKYIQVIALFSLLVLSVFALSAVLIRQNFYLSPGYFIVPLSVYLFMLAMFLFILYYRDQKYFYEKMAKGNEAMIDSMALVAETRDTETGAHIIRTKEYIRLLSNYLVSQGFFRDILTFEYRRDLYHATPMHDIGKVGIPDAILKKNGKLTVEEFEIMKTHSYLGKRIIENAISKYQQNTILILAQNIAHFHHEKWDGSGYPNGLKEDEIPLEARLMAIADVYDALISRRVYKEPFSYDLAESIITQGRGNHFDPILVDAFLSIKEQFKEIAERIKQ